MGIVQHGRLRTENMSDHQTDLCRCPWPGIGDPEYERYHDVEWGVPQTDDRKLFEKLVLEGFQSGLSWLTILRKRDAFRRAFDGFDPDRVARYDEPDVAKLLSNPHIVRNRAKIEAAITNARAYLSLIEKMSLRELAWGSVGGRPVTNTYVAITDVPVQTDASRDLAKALKSRGFQFVGATTAYAFMQATGVVNDHLVDCHRHAVCARLQQDTQA